MRAEASPCEAWGTKGSSSCLSLDGGALPRAHVETGSGAQGMRAGAWCGQCDTLCSVKPLLLVEEGVKRSKEIHFLFFLLL